MKKQILTIMLLLSLSYILSAQKNNFNDSLYYASEKNDTSLLKEYIIKGADLNYFKSKRKPVLHIACYNKNYNAAKILIENGANIDIKDNSGWTALMYVCESVNNLGIIPFTEYLIDKGANVNTVNIYKSSALHKACMNSQSLELIKLLVEKGADIHAVDKYGNTPLHEASKNEYGLSIVKYLLERGAIIDINKKGSYGNTPLHNTSQPHNGSFETAKLLVLNGANINAVNKEGETPLLLSLIAMRKKMAHFYIDQGADIHIKSNYGYTNLKAAVVFDLELVKYFVENGADVNHKGINGRTAINNAVFSTEGIKTAEYLINQGAELNIINKYGITPLSDAVWSSFGDDVALYFLEKGANPNTVYTSEHISFIGYSPLMIAVMKNKFEIVNKLAQSGANINVVAKDGKTAVLIAKEKKYTEIYNFLIEQSK